MPNQNRSGPSVIGLPNPSASATCVTVSKALRRKREREVGANRAHAGDHGAKEPRAVLERAAEITRALVGAEQLMVEVSVAGLEVDEIEPGDGGVHGGSHEVVSEGVELVIGEERLVGRRTDGCIHVRVTSHGDRGGHTVWCRVAHAARVCELKADDQV